MSTSYTPITSAPPLTSPDPTLTSTLMSPVISSLLDTDLYKLTMQAVVVGHYADAEVEYLLTNRSIDKHLTAEVAEWIRSEIDAMEHLKFQEDEIEYLKTAVPYLPEYYLDYLKKLRLEPRTQVTVKFDQDVEIVVRGPWRDTILYEIPILALVSEAYFRFVDTKWSAEGQFEQAKQKALNLAEAGCTFSEFGTRRRRSKVTQHTVLEGLVAAGTSSLIGTSNVQLAKEFNLQPIGTVAHELMMGIAAYHNNYKDANKLAMDAWLQTVGSANAGLALTDTFGTPNFLSVFVKPYTDSYVGVRQDSGDPVEYTRLIAKHYEALGYAPNTKRILYSDSLNFELCKQYKKAAEEAGLLPGFGVGTWLTNDFKGLDGAPSKPLNIVMKLSSVNGHACVKLSDNIGKNMGDKEALAEAKKQVGYVASDEAIDEAKRW